MQPMRWYWHQGGGHVHVRVFMNGGKCGDMCFRTEEFDWIRVPMEFANEGRVAEFIEELPAERGPFHPPEPPATGPAAV